ncbi:DUF2087 domain-containing protein [Gracilibacillus caseinilyticus]|uniref:DUF2087 domain-containing protein n=1 Tax=Gracilibacillus caseinilyticus TaxID=2932256 RepID=A0ABY4F4D3_9BACI|nr:DUF2087 domain-containing protein [Gracilibacillus caseinilyticus]UOQ49331.1 DUF2087 domain-containing protein [Gracilibacillus caseinilyticus]
MSNSERFWNATIDELSKGYVYEREEQEYVCLLCNQKFEDGIIYPIDDTLFEARRAVVHHIEATHISVFHYLIKLGKKNTGLSEHQQDLLLCFKEGLTDKEIVKQQNGGSTSTIRNHRFKLREREKQAKVFLTLMNLLDSTQQKQEKLVEFHKGATMVDDRYATTEEEKQKILNTYFKQGVDGALETFPSKEKRKIIVLQNIAKRFEMRKVYKEKEVNEILKEIYNDFVTIRRYLIEYGFLNRSKDCTEYWVKN